MYVNKRQPSRCDFCGRDSPVAVKKEEVARGSYELRCAQCGNHLLIGSVAKGGEFPKSASAQLERESPVIGDDTVFRHMEIWTDGRALVSLIHGRIVRGNREFYDYVQYLLSQA